MNIIELREKGKVGDILEYSERPNVKYFFEGYGITLLNARNCQINYWKFLTGEWEIIPHEPKILTIETIHKTSRIHGSNSEIQYGQRCHDNGRLEIWLEFKNYLDEKKYKTAFCHDPLSLIDAVKKLKPNQSPEN